MLNTQAQERHDRFKDQALKEFNDWAESYDRSLLNHFLFEPAYLVMMEEIARWRLGHPDPFRLLDVGCGTGTFAHLLSNSPWPVTVHGLDYSPAMCALAGTKRGMVAESDRAVFIAGDSEHLPFPDASFDLVTCANSFHHYPHQQAVIHEMHRVLRPGGQLFLIDGFRDNTIGWVVFDVIITRIERSVYHAPWHEIDGMFRSAGFTSIRRTKFNFLFPLLLTVGTA